MYLMVDAIIPQILIYLADFSRFAQKLTSNVGFSSANYDWLIILFVVFSVLVIALSFGRSRMLLALLSLYIAAFLESNFVYFDKIKQISKDKLFDPAQSRPDYWLHIFLFLLIYVLVFALLNRSIFKSRLTLGESSVFLVFFVAIAEAGFLASLLISYLPSELIQRIPTQVLPFLATKNALFWWALIPLLILLFSKHKTARSSPDL